MTRARHARHARHARRRRHIDARPLMLVAALIAALLVGTGPTPAGATETAAPRRTTSTIDYGSGLWAGTTSPVVRTGDPAAADVLIFGDSITVRCAPDLAALLATKGKTLAVIAQSSQRLQGLVDLLEAEPALPAKTILAAGTNDVFDPLAAAAQLTRAKTVVPDGLVLVDTYVGRTATAAHDIRNSGWVNGQIHAAGVPVVGWVAALSAAVGRGRTLDYYLQDKVHPWAAAGTTPYVHGDGCAFWASIIATGAGL